MVATLWPQGLCTAIFSAWKLPPDSHMACSFTKSVASNRLLGPLYFKCTPTPAIFSVVVMTFVLCSLPVRFAGPSRPALTLVLWHPGSPALPHSSLNRLHFPISSLCSGCAFSLEFLRPSALRLIFPEQCQCNAAAAAAKSLQSCPTLCDPTDGSPPGSPVPGILQARTLEWVAIAFSNA